MITPNSWGWTYDGSSDYSIGPIEDPQVNPVAHVYNRDPKRGAELCNLIAAAPDLLAALKSALPHVAAVYRAGGIRHLPNSGDVIEQIDAAIAKAEGRTA